MFCARLCGEEHAQDVDVRCPLELRGGVFEGRGFVEDAGGRDEPVDAWGGSCDLVDDVVGGYWVADVEVVVVESAGAGFGCVEKFHRGAGEDVEAVDVGAGFEEGERLREAEAAAAAGYEDSFGGDVEFGELGRG